jgi:cytochrome c peroxidase
MRIGLPLSGYLLLRADYSLVQDKSFKKYVQAYAADEALFFKE